MTSDTNAPVADNGAGPDSQEYRNYDDMLSTLDTLLDEAMRKVDSGRVYDAENERVRIKWIRVACQVVDTHRKVRADRDLEELSERVERLEAADQPDLSDVLRGDGR